MYRIDFSGFRNHMKDASGRLVCQEGQVHCDPVLLGSSLLLHVLEDEVQLLPCPGPVIVV
ncbi:hypothetical protein L798_13126 [Zootermopsis nevadensis]|uniref:Uncharacterized protein n=1 Tax=Zootermopsis nevadensis TaxID=136037 RepID=A0A067R4L2_ZOONE|nr:hypothetical protein L798_13126 [Zootermopsis nevadensis]